MTVPPSLPWLMTIGFVAQLIDGCIGMGYGTCSSAILAMCGVPPAITSATVHAAECVTAGVSSVSHAWFRNIDRRIFGALLLPGVVGGILGASVLTHVPTLIIRPFVWGYLFITSLVVLIACRLRFRRKVRHWASWPVFWPQWVAVDGERS